MTKLIVEVILQILPQYEREMIEYSNSGAYFRTHI